LKGTHPGTIPARFGLIWFRSFKGEDLNVIFYQNMPNLFYQIFVFGADLKSNMAATVHNVFSLAEIF
jgi:hypothetical protein